MLRSIFVALIACVAVSTAHAQNVQWDRQLVDYTFRSEGVAAGDFNKDGKMDIAAGDVWYAAPDWTMHEFRPAGKYYYFKGYSNSFCNFMWDLNADGWDDIIVIGFPGEPFHWYENPQNKPGHWKEHVIWHSACNESPLFTDITGDGKPEIILGSQPEGQMGYLEIPDPKDADKK
ncbi:MAG TPA: FG-GAP-like repeat-containing protein, partial [Planctomycetaceae bacterium]|nr:FG-GAP-like repeat-containing protein [Planctomycetaceae bacterium]